MPYTTAVTLAETGGGASVTTPATARLWMLWSVVGTGSGTGPQQDERESVDVDLRADWSTPVPVSFVQDATFASVSRGVGLSIQDRGAVASDRGWLFRSGEFEQTLPQEDIEVIGAERTITAADLPALLPTPPMTIDAQTTVTAFTATLADPPGSGQPGGIDFTATGTTTKTGVVVGFRYTGTIRLEPMGLVARAGEAFSVGVANPAIVFLPGPSVLSAIEAELLNALRLFIMRELAPQVRRGIEARINAGIASDVGRSLPGGALPAGVVLSVRTVSVNSSRIAVRAGLGAFGGVMSKLPQPPGGGGGRICASQSLLALGHPVTGMATLRRFRDADLAGTPSGRRLIELYYAHGEELSALFRARPGLAARVALAVREVSSALEAHRLPETLRVRCETLALEVAAAGSPQLRGSIGLALGSDAWRRTAG